MKIAILTDSSSDLTNNQINNIFVLPLPIIFPNQTVVEDIKTDKVVQTQILDNIGKIDLKTSALNPGILEFKIKEILENYDHVIYFPIAYNLSSQYQNSLILLNDQTLANKITIVKHYFTGLQLGQFILTLIPFLNNLKSMADLKLNQLVKKWSQNSSLMVVPGDLELLKKGGRVNELIIKFLSKRNFKVAILWGHKSKKIISKNYQNLVSKYLTALKKQFANLNGIKIYLAHTSRCDEKIKQIIIAEFAKYDVILSDTNLPTIFAIHGGVNTLGFVAVKEK